MAEFLKPAEIYYSQDSINSQFSNGMLIGETLDDLYEGRLTVDDIEAISVTKVDGKWITWDNRRLWVFRHLERLGKCKTIPVIYTGKVLYYRMTSKCAGQDVTVRGDPGGRWYKESPSSLLWDVAKVAGIGAIIFLGLGKR